MNEVERLRADQSRSAGARTIPDGAAELVAKRMLRIKLYGVALSARYDWQAHRQWTQQLTDDERADWLRDARALLADLGATPTTGPAPAAADECSCNGGWVEDQNYQPEDYERNDPLVPEKGLIPCGSCNHGGWDAPWPPEPAAPQAPAQPTAHVMLCPTRGTYTAAVPGETCVNDDTVLRPAAREDTAPPDDYGDNLTAGFLRPSTNDLGDIHPSGPVAPPCADCGQAPATDPRLTVNDQRVCDECWTDVEANGTDDPEEV